MCSSVRVEGQGWVRRLSGEVICQVRRSGSVDAEIGDDTGVREDFFYGRPTRQSG